MGVWWDMDTCLLPPDLDRHKIRQRIESALEKHLPFTISAIPCFTISAIGDLRRIPEADLEAILSTGFFTKHVIDGEFSLISLDIQFRFFFFQLGFMSSGLIFQVRWAFCRIWVVGRRIIHHRLR